MLIRSSNSRIGWSSFANECYQQAFEGLEGDDGSLIQTPADSTVTRSEEVLEILLVYFVLSCQSCYLFIGSVAHRVYYQLPITAQSRFQRKLLGHSPATSILLNLYPAPLPTRHLFISVKTHVTFWIGAVAANTPLGPFAETMQRYKMVASLFGACGLCAVPALLSTGQPNILSVILGKQHIDLFDDNRLIDDPI